MQKRNAGNYGNYGRYADERRGAGHAYARNRRVPHEKRQYGTANTLIQRRRIF